MSSILVTRRLPASALAILREVGDVDVPDHPLDRTALLAAVNGRAALVSFFMDPVDAELLDAAGPDLKVVSNVAVGIDNIDMAAARARRVVVTNTPDVLTNAVAELAWGLILAVARRIGEAERLVRRGDWKSWSLDFLTGMELSGKQLGVVGAGRIGRAVAAKAEAFGMRVVFVTHGLANDVDGHPTCSLDELLVGSDVVTVHVPPGPGTRHLIDRKALMRMKRTAYLVNAARGPIVDEEALVWALDERLIAGAALDVFEREPTVHPKLLSMEHVVLTPHIGSATREARTGMAELAAKNVAAVLRGRSPLTPVGG